MARGALMAALLLPLVACSEKKLAAMPAFHSFKVIRPTVAFQLIRDNPELMVLDVRSVQAFNGPHGHISGAVNVPVAELPAFLNQGRFPKKRALLVYGEGNGDEGNAVLVEHGFRYVFRIEDGIEGWIRAGLGTMGGTDEAR